MRIIIPALLFVLSHAASARSSAILASHDNHQHAENENLQLLNFCNGIESMAAIMNMR